MIGSMERSCFHEVSNDFYSLISTIIIGIIIQNYYFVPKTNPLILLYYSCNILGFCVSRSFNHFLIIHI